MASSGYLPPLFQQDLSSLKIGIVYTRWNQEIITHLLEGAKKVLDQFKVAHIKTLEVPGAFELPMGAKFILQQEKVDAVICLGCIIKGETDHDRYIAEAVSQGLTLLGLQSGVPCIFGVLTTNTLEQAWERAQGPLGHKGEEAAYAALEMAGIKNNLKSGVPKIGY